ncbi:hypothetical protein VOLCADRAFT_100571 [Volvox carteri f. nagariensis]|uniref:Uncharacterized protein n=1 Tax=Volvox carteri f. nagariensis TaxID=3068 RepID=D8UKI6_VOLCA|nr:uncharacterized protein VOLCADRAFT_100571 [Volvox carteri f. nagariensis]EFJ39759.1 hypothetical protein VOLCADRAFT_100571 [Volvox carteri f. nagariensis]|eukprot:XP_002959169.1 hypothetical protein VOLCADRAFT_100571 [Volvox carteri f. nagariensis]
MADQGSDAAAVAKTSSTLARITHHPAPLLCPNNDNNHNTSRKTAFLANTTAAAAAADDGTAQQAVKEVGCCSAYQQPQQLQLLLPAGCIRTAACKWRRGDGERGGFQDHQNDLLLLLASGALVLAHFFTPRQQASAPPPLTLHAASTVPCSPSRPPVATMTTTTTTAVDISAAPFIAAATAAATAPVQFLPRTVFSDHLTPPSCSCPAAGSLRGSHSRGPHQMLTAWPQTAMGPAVGLRDGSPANEHGVVAPSTATMVATTTAAMECAAALMMNYCPAPDKKIRLGTAPPTSTSFVPPCRRFSLLATTASSSSSRGRSEDELSPLLRIHNQQSHNDARNEVAVQQTAVLPSPSPHEGNRDNYGPPMHFNNLDQSVRCTCRAVYDGRLMANHVCDVVKDPKQQQQLGGQKRRLLDFVWAHDRYVTWSPSPYFQPSYDNLREASTRPLVSTPPTAMLSSAPSLPSPLPQDYHRYNRPLLSSAIRDPSESHPSRRQPVSHDGGLLAEVGAQQGGQQQQQPRICSRVASAEANNGNFVDKGCGDYDCGNFTSAPAAGLIVVETPVAVSGAEDGDDHDDGGDPQRMPPSSVRQISTAAAALEGVRKSLKKGPHGRCIGRCGPCLGRTIAGAAPQRASATGPPLAEPGVEVSAIDQRRSEIGWLGGEGDTNNRKTVGGKVGGELSATS